MDGHDTCYVCGAPATSEDHVPPKGFYPTRQDLTHGTPTAAVPDYRTNLIKVSACHEHNGARSKDDGYTQGIIVTFSAMLRDSIEPGNRVPFVDQWIERLRLGPRLSAWLDSGVPTQTPSGDEVVQTTVDEAAVRRVLEATARGLYFHHHGGTRRWPGRCNVQVPAFADARLLHHPAKEPLEQMMRGFADVRANGSHPAGVERGPHPDVFYYQIFEKSGAVLMLMVFYRTFPAIAMTTSSRSKPRGFNVPDFDFVVHVP